MQNLLCDDMFQHPYYSGCYNIMHNKYKAKSTHAMISDSSRLAKKQVKKQVKLASKHLIETDVSGPKFTGGCYS